MAGTAVEFDFSDFTQFFTKMRQAAAGDLKQEVALIIEDIGHDLLDVIGDEIIRRKVVDTQKLLGSFRKGGDGNVWEVTDDGLTLEIGTNVEHARHVNDGHWANPGGVASRFVPGVWAGDRFIYQPGAKTGMVLKQQWVDGKKYWEASLRIIEKMIPGLLEERIQQWLDNYFK